MGTGTAPEGEGYPPPPRSHTPSAMSQGSEAGTAASGEGDEEKRLRAALRHLQVEAGVLERLVYKHRNQHRGAAYFQYLLKVRPGRGSSTPPPDETSHPAERVASFYARR